MKFLADTHDPRTGPALAKALKDYEPGKNDEDVKYAAQGGQRGWRRRAKLTTRRVIDALWNCFAKFQVSKAKIERPREGRSTTRSSRSATRLRPEGDRKLNAPVDPKNVDSRRRPAPVLAAHRGPGHRRAEVHDGGQAARHGPAHADEDGPRRDHPARAPQDGEGRRAGLIKALNGTDKRLREAREAIDKDKDVRRRPRRRARDISRPAGRDAILAALADRRQRHEPHASRAGRSPSSRGPAGRAGVPRGVQEARRRTRRSPLIGGANAHGVLAQASANFYDPTLTDWLVKEIDDARRATRPTRCSSSRSRRRSS